MFKTTNGFDKLSLTDFITTLHDISTGMTGNAHFPNLQDDVVAFNNEKDDYIYQAQKARNGSAVDIAIRNAKRAVLVDEMRVLGNNVTAVCEGDLAMLKSSGFPISRVPQTSPDLTTPGAPIVFLEVNKGELVCMAKSQRGTINFLYMISSDPGTESSWKIQSLRGTSYTFTNLVSGTTYYIKYAVCGVRNQQVVSDMVSFIPQ